MGCVQSHENKHRINQPLNHNNKSRQPQRRLVSGSNTNAPPVLISHHINGGSEVKRSAFPTPQNQKIEGNGNEKEKSSSSGIEGVHFQRQSFDRNSCLRKSSKRTRKNSAASANTSTTANGSVTTSPRNTKWSTEAKNVNVPLPVSANTAPLEASLDPPQPVCKTDENLSSHRHQQSQSTKNGLNGLNDEASPVTSLTSPQSHGASEPPQRGDFSASANVAALLGIKPQVTSASEQQPLWEQPPAEEQWLFHPASPSFHIGDHTHSALPPQTTAATMTTFEAIQTAAAARSASSNGFSMMSASEVAKRDMIKKITASTTGPTTATVAAIKSRRSSAPLASAASNSTDHRNRKSRKTSVPIPPAPPPRASSTGISSATPTASTASTATSSSLRTRREAAAATEREKVFREKEAHVEEEELEDCGRLI